MITNLRGGEWNGSFGIKSPRKLAKIMEIQN